MSVMILSSRKTSSVMCVSFWAQDCHPLYSLLLISNRDEFVSRPTLPAHWWDEEEGESPGGRILGGKDLQAGGTWLACTTTGRLALLTNFRAPGAQPQAQSRGELPDRFLRSSKSPQEYAEEVAADAHRYNGFNLLVADLRTSQMVYCTNRSRAEPAGFAVHVQQVAAGMHAMSNGFLDSPWPKVELGLQKLRALLADAHGDEVPAPKLVQDVLMDTQKADRTRLPLTGYGADVEFEMSSIFVDCPTPQGSFGTRNMAVLAVRKNGNVTFYERHLEAGDWKEHSFRFAIQVPAVL